MSDRSYESDDARFEALIAETLRDMPSVTPSVNFADKVVDALPQEAPVVLPVPRPALNPWRWMPKVAAAIAAISVGLWFWRTEVMMWLKVQTAVISFDVMLMIADLQTGLTNADLSVMTALAMGFFGLAAWIGTALASSGRPYHHHA